MKAALSQAPVLLLKGPVLTAAATVLAGAAALAGPLALAVPGGLLLAFVLPGLALAALIFRYRTLSWVERAVVAAGLSMATIVVAGLGLFVAGFKLDRVSWTLGTAGITLFALAIKAVPERVWQGEDEDDAVTQEIPSIRSSLPGPFAVRGRVDGRRLVRQLLPMVLVLAVVGGAGWLSYRSSHNSYQVTVTALSAAPPGAAAADGTRTVDVTASGLVASDGPYSLVVTGPNGTRTDEHAVPATGGTWTAALTLPAETRMVIGLYRAGDTAPYRTVIVAATE